METWDTADTVPQGRVREHYPLTTPPSERKVEHGVDDVTLDTYRGWSGDRSRRKPASKPLNERSWVFLFGGLYLLASAASWISQSALIIFLTQNS